MVFANTAMASRANLEREMLSWIETEGVIPPGNGPEQELWEVQPVICMTIHDYTRQTCTICVELAMNTVQLQACWSPVCCMCTMHAWVYCISCTATGWMRVLQHCAEGKCDDNTQVSAGKFLEYLDPCFDQGVSTLAAGSDELQKSYSESTKHH